MLRNPVCAVIVFLLAGVANAGEPNEVLAKVKAASGGAAWDAIRTARTRMTVSVGGLTGTAETLDDVTLGRVVDHFKLGPRAAREGFDGAARGRRTTRVSRARKRAATAPRSGQRVVPARHGFWHPERWPARIEDAGTQEENGRQFLVVRITPKGGRPFDLWIDAATMLIDRTVEKTAIETRTTLMTDYRTVGGVKIAFASGPPTATRATTSLDGRERRVQRAGRRTPRSSSRRRRRPTSRSPAARPPPPSRSSWSTTTSTWTSSSTARAPTA